MDIVKVISERLGVVKNGSKYKSVCPFHVDSLKVKTLHIDPDKQTFVCMQCHAQGDVKEFLKKYEG